MIGLYRRFSGLVHELAKFGSIGAVAFVITLIFINLFHVVLGVGPLISTGLANVIATIFAYFANRHWTFKERENSGLRREFGLFFILNAIGIAITEVFVGFNYYVLHDHGKVSYNIANILGTGVATLFRYWSYKRWVFLRSAPADEATSSPESVSP
jgi:putative flippase GtrA